MRLPPQGLAAEAQRVRPQPKPEEDTKFRNAALLGLCALVAGALTALPSVAGAQSGVPAAVIAKLESFPYDSAVRTACATDRGAIADSVAVFDVLLDSLPTAIRAEVFVDAFVRRPAVRAAGNTALSFSYSPPGSDRNLGAGCTLATGVTLRIVARRLGGGELRFVSDWPVLLRLRDDAWRILVERTFYSRPTIPTRLSWSKP